MVLLKNAKESSLSNSACSLNSNNDIHTVYLGDLDLNTSERTISEFFRSINVAILKTVKQPHSSYAHVTFEDAQFTKRLLDKAVIYINQRPVRVMPFNQPSHFDPNANLIIKNLESYLDESNIIKKFAPFGDILSCKLVRDERGESKCYAYLQYKCKESAAEAIDNLNNTYWDERCDPDFKFKQLQSLPYVLRTGMGVGKLNEINMQENELAAHFNKFVGKKIYVGIFKKKEEYSKLKSEKEGKLSNLYVKNFGPTFGDRELFQLFKAYGSIKSAKVRRQKVGNIEKPLGCGFVDFELPEDADKARQALDGFVLDNGRVISVKFADCKSRRARKKLEETDNDNYNQHQQQQQQQKEQQTNNSSAYESESDQHNTSENDMINEHTDYTFISSSANQIQSIERKNSMSSVSSSCMDTTHCMDEFEWPDIWSKLLQSSDWKEYKLF